MCHDIVMCNDRVYVHSFASNSSNTSVYSLPCISYPQPRHHLICVYLTKELFMCWPANMASTQAGRQAGLLSKDEGLVGISLKVCLLTSVIKTSSGVTKTIRHVPHRVFPVVRSVGIFQQVRRKLLCNIPIGSPSIGRGERPSLKSWVRLSYPGLSADSSCLGPILSCMRTKRNIYGFQSLDSRVLRDINKSLTRIIHYQVTNKHYGVTSERNDLKCRLHISIRIANHKHHDMTYDI